MVVRSDPTFLSLFPLLAGLSEREQEKKSHIIEQTNRGKIEATKTINEFCYTECRCFHGRSAVLLHNYSYIYCIWTVLVCLLAVLAVDS